MSTAVLCGERPRKIAIKFKLGQPLPVPRTLHRKRGRVRIEGSDETRKIEVGVVRDPYRGYHVGQVVDRPRTSGAFTRAFVSASGRAETQRIRERKAERALAKRVMAERAREHEEAFAYLEGLAALDELDRAAFDSALERTDLEPEVLS